MLLLCGRNPFLQPHGQCFHSVPVHFRCCGGSLAFRWRNGAQASPLPSLPCARPAPQCKWHCAGHSCFRLVHALLLVFVPEASSSSSSLATFKAEREQSVCLALFPPLPESLQRGQKNRLKQIEAFTILRHVLSQGGICVLRGWLCEQCKDLNWILSNHVRGQAPPCARL